ncbi:MAG: hypothetical protein CL843_07790 [Crocinitomicaceae bacterium]|nr:hypothetical protein [Crocinitomicaceae bacterium]
MIFRKKANKLKLVLIDCTKLNVPRKLLFLLELLLSASEIVFGLSLVLIKKAQKKIEWAFRDLGYAIGTRKLPNANAGRQIMLYHGVTKNAKLDINARFISTAQFEQQISYMQSNFHVVSLDEYFKGATHPSKLTIAITFDDGYLNNLIEALPILEKYEVPATFFVTTIREAGYDVLWADVLDLYGYTGGAELTFNGECYIRKNNDFWSGNNKLKNVLKATGWEEKQQFVDEILASNAFLNDPHYFPYFKLMDEQELQKLSASPYATLGSHGLYHNCLDHVSISACQKELEVSKNYLENITQKEVTSLAYPDGSYTREIVDLAEKTGYTMQLSVEQLFAEDTSDFRIENRFGVNPYIRFNNQMECIINGRY